MPGKRIVPNPDKRKKFGGSSSTPDVFYYWRFNIMKLFSKIFIYLLFVIISVLVIEGNLNYESEIRQFDIDMANSAKQIGKIVAGMVAHTWNENNPQTAINSIEDSNQAADGMTIAWVHLDDILKTYGPENPELLSFKKIDFNLPVSFIATDKHRKKHRFTFVPVDVSGKRKGMIQL
jgi:hypothetical protein